MRLWFGRRVGITVESATFVDERGAQGLKPIDLIGFIGTTEVVPCYKAPFESSVYSGRRTEMPPEMERPGMATFWISW